MNLSKCFLANRDNFCPYEQALRLTRQKCPVRYFKPYVSLLIAGGAKAWEASCVTSLLT